MKRRQVEERVGLLLFPSQEWLGVSLGVYKPCRVRGSRSPVSGVAAPEGNVRSCRGKRTGRSSARPGRAMATGAVSVPDLPSQVLSAPLLHPQRPPDSNPRSQQVSNTGEPRGFKLSCSQYQVIPCPHTGVGNESSLRFSCSGNQGCLFMPFTFVSPRNPPR